MCSPSSPPPSSTPRDVMARLVSAVAAYRGDAAAAPRVVQGLDQLAKVIEVDGAAAELESLLPFLLLPVQVALDPRRPKNALETETTETPPPTSALVEAALLCAAAAARAWGPRFALNAGPAAVFGLVTRAAAVLGKQEPPPSEHVRLACARFLEAIFSAPLLVAPSSPPSPSSPAPLLEKEAQAWDEARELLRRSLGGTLVAQLAHGLLTLAAPGSGRELQLRALSALRALLALLPDPALWLRFLPGTFSGLARLAAPLAPRALPPAAVAAAALEVAVAVAAVALGGKDGDGEEGASAAAAAATLEGKEEDSPAIALHRMAATVSSSFVTSASGTSAVKPTATSSENGVAKEGNWEAEDAAMRLCEALPPLLARCRRHTAWQVRLAAAAAAGELLNRLGNGLLWPCRAELLEAAAASLWDVMPPVAAAAATAVTSVTRAASSGRAAAGPAAFAAGRALRHAAILPQLARSGEEAHVRDGLDVLSGSLCLANGGCADDNEASRGSTAAAAAVLETGLPRALAGLAEVFRVDTAALGTGVVARLALETAAEAVAAGRPAEVLYDRRPLLHVREEATLAAARRAVRLLAGICEPWALADALLCPEAGGLLALRPLLRPALFPVSASGLLLHEKQGWASSSNNNSRVDEAWAEARLQQAALLTEAAMGWSGSSSGRSSGDSEEESLFRPSSLPRRRPPTELAGAVAERLLHSDAWAAAAAASPSDGPAVAALAPALCEALGSLFRVAADAGGEDGQLLLLRALFPLLERAAEPRPATGHAALAVLRLAAHSLGYGGSIPALLAANMDYVVDAAARRMAESSSAAAGGSDVAAAGRLAAVVEAVLTHGGAEAAATPFARDLCQAALRAADAVWWDDGRAGGRAATASLGVLRAVVLGLRMPKSGSRHVVYQDRAEKQRGGSGKTGEKGQQAEEVAWLAQLAVDFGGEESLSLKEAHVGEGRQDGSGSLAERWEGARREAAAAAAAAAAADEADAAADKQREEEQRRLAESSEVVMVREVLLRVSYLLAAPAPRVAAAAAAAARECLAKLAAVGAETVLLQAVHAIWPSLASCVKERSRGPTSNNIRFIGEGAAAAAVAAPPGSLAHVLETAAFVAELCGDFCAARVAEDLWPVLKSLLLAASEGSDSSIWRGRGSATRAALRCLEALAASKGCRGFMAPLAGEAAAMVLPALFVDDSAVNGVAQRSLGLLARLDGDAVWLLLLERGGSCGEERKSPLPGLPLLDTVKAVSSASRGASVAGGAASLAAGAARGSEKARRLRLELEEMEGQGQ